MRLFRPHLVLRKKDYITVSRREFAFSVHRLLHLLPNKAEALSTMKVLMLHGYTQTGQLFHAKTRVLEKHLSKVFPGISLSYPTGPLRLKATDVPGVDASTIDDPDAIEAYGWWRRSNTQDPPEYMGLDKGLEVVAKVLESEGPFDGVMGFSQGACMAAMVTSLLEGDSRRQAFKNAQSKSSLAISYPSSFEKLNHPPLKFCVLYAGFVAPGERYRGFYESPHIQTPSCHFIGSLDTLVEESRTQALVDAFGGVNTQVVTHPGGHFVPSGKQYLDIVGAFMKNRINPTSNDSVKEENVEDMDVPF